MRAPTPATLGLLATTLFAGIGTGALLSRRGESPPSPSAEPVPAAAPAATAPVQAPPAAREPEAWAPPAPGIPLELTSLDRAALVGVGGDYSPIAGPESVLAGSWAPSRSDLADTLPAAPAAGAENAAAPAAAEAPASKAPPRPAVGDEGPVDLLRDRAVLASPRLAVRRAGGKVVLYETRSGSLPERIEGRWTFIEACDEFRVDLAMRGGGAVGEIRAVGRGSGGAKAGWAVPARGCAAAGAKLKRPKAGRLTDPAGVEWTLEGRDVVARRSGEILWRQSVPSAAADARLLGHYRTPGLSAGEVWVLAYDESGDARALLRVVSSATPSGRWANLGPGAWAD